MEKVTFIARWVLFLAAIVFVFALFAYVFKDGLLPQERDMMFILLSGSVTTILSYFGIKEYRRKFY